MANLTIKIEKEDIKISEIGNNIMVNCENNINLVFTRQALEELINDYNDIKKDDVINKVNDRIILDTTLCEIDNDFATKEQRETFLVIMNKITVTKKHKETPNSVFYMVGNLVYMEQDLKTDNFYIRYGNFWEVFEMKFDLNYKEIKELLRGLLEERLNCKVNTTKQDKYHRMMKLEERLNCKVNTTVCRG